MGVDQHSIGCRILMGVERSRKDGRIDGLPLLLRAWRRLALLSPGNSLGLVHDLFYRNSIYIRILVHFKRADYSISWPAFREMPEDYFLLVQVRGHWLTHTIQTS